MKRISKGHPVKVFIPQKCSVDDKLCPVRVSVVRENGDLEKAWMVEAFVSGDTEELGLSVVALNDPTDCLYHYLKGLTCGSEKAERNRESIRKGFLVYADAVSSDYSIFNQAPSCPY